MNGDTSAAPATRTAPLALQMCRVSKRFHGTLAVDCVDFEVLPGEVHALVGENGAGKSTLMKMLAGLFGDYEGDILIQGDKQHLHTPTMAKQHGIGMVYQELSLARSISIYENLLVGRLPKKNALFIDKKKALIEAKALLEQVGLGKIDPRLDVAEISQCEAQLVEIAKVLGSEPSVIVMDEPTSALSSEEVKRLYDIIEQLKAKGIAIIFISHHLQEVFAVADRVTVMRDGKQVGTYNIKDIDTEFIVEKMVGKSIKDFYCTRHPVVTDDVMLEVNDLTRWGFFHQINFKLYRGEVLAICGLAGSGRTEIAMSIVGAAPQNGGVIKIKGEEKKINSVSDAIAEGVAYLTEDRKVVGLALTQDVRTNVLAPIIDNLASGPFYHPARHEAIVEQKIEALSIHPNDPERLVGSLSGGNQQKVLLSKWLATDADIMILDEPTRGVDVGAKQVIHDTILQYAEEGHSVILLSSDLPEVVGLASRVLILREGHLIGELGIDDISENAILLAMNGKGEHVAC